MIKFLNRIFFRFASQPLNKLLYGGSFKVVHICADTGNRKCFWCDTWQDAIEWVSCGLNCDKVTVTNTAGFVLAQRG